MLLKMMINTCNLVMFRDRQAFHGDIIWLVFLSLTFLPIEIVSVFHSSSCFTTKALSPDASEQ